MRRISSESQSRKVAERSISARTSAKVRPDSCTKIGAISSARWRTSAAARRISAACEAALAADPTLGGVCTQVLRVTGRQWLRDDGAEQRLARMNTRLECAYRTRSTDPFTPF